MLSKLKEYFWWIVGGLAVLFVVVILRDSNRAQELASFFRRKKVEDDVNKIREVIASREGNVKATDAELVELAEKYKAEKGSASKASEEEIHDFYKDFFGK